MSEGNIQSYNLDIFISVIKNGKKKKTLHDSIYLTRRNIYYEWITGFGVYNESELVVEW